MGARPEPRAAVTTDPERTREHGSVSRAPEAVPPALGWSACRWMWSDLAGLREGLPKQRPEEHGCPCFGPSRGTRFLLQTPRCSPPPGFGKRAPSAVMSILFGKGRRLREWLAGGGLVATCHFCGFPLARGGWQAAPRACLTNRAGWPSARARELLLHRHDPPRAP